ncbi:MAG TPA: hypothetical protein VGQ83_28160 [Polyangia bacterium]|jgi:hypothetical protein
MDQPDRVDDFREYLARFDAAAGPHDFGDFVKHCGRLVKKLTYDEFVERFDEFIRLKTAYEDIFQRGDTINDAMVRVLRERAAELMIEPPA